MYEQHKCTLAANAYLKGNMVVNRKFSVTVYEQVCCMIGDLLNFYSVNYPLFSFLFLFCIAKSAT